MTEIVVPGAGLVYMKVGTHANEPFDQIFERKRKEIEDEGFALWGYGGNTCHPLSMVQPFAEGIHEQGGIIRLVMQPMTSRHFTVSARAEEYSADALDWTAVPRGINVLGSRYALKIANLREEAFDLPLSQTRVAIGPTTGRRGDRYIKGHVDKACLEVTDAVPEDDDTAVAIQLVADLVEPYAVFVR
jgi:hypothetical protein